MDNSVELKAIWRSAKTDELPSSAEMLKMIKQFRGQKVRNKWMVITVAGLLTVLMLVIMFTDDSHLFIKQIGDLLIMASSALLAATNIKSLKRFKELNDDCSNIDFLAFIEQTRQNQIYYYKKTQARIMILCSSGLFFYMYEPATKGSWWFTGIYLVCIIYLLVIWLVVRPRTFKKNAAKLEATRQQLEKILNQLK